VKHSTFMLPRVSEIMRCPLASQTRMGGLWETASNPCDSPLLLFALCSKLFNGFASGPHCTLRDRNPSRLNKIFRAGLTHQIGLSGSLLAADLPHVKDVSFNTTKTSRSGLTPKERPLHT